MVKARNGRIRRARGRPGPGWPGAGRQRDQRRARWRIPARQPDRDRDGPALGGPAFIEIIDRCLDRGIVVEGWARVALLDVDILTLEALAVVTSCESYLRHAAAVEQTVVAPLPPP